MQARQVEDSLHDDADVGVGLAGALAARLDVGVDRRLPPGRPLPGVFPVEAKLSFWGHGRPGGAGQEDDDVQVAVDGALAGDERAVPHERPVAEHGTEAPLEAGDCVLHQLARCQVCGHEQEVEQLVLDGEFDRPA
ncbi:hypothetical protein [Azospirillum canadense]|uniref:hypothetical protein n=1 Tax=Azospirillum canadense TaxID=403962 RepID=UPI00222650AC|nr:hypothetical protein [Azospirillum canadense]MCW2237470.1 hypothetical protein [Azospirillum canadense]